MVSVNSSSAIPAPEGFLFGCDPELFVVDDNGRYVTAEGLLPGTKNRPSPVNKGAIQVDGMAAEFNIDPVDNFNDFSNNIQEVVHQLQDHLPPGYSLADKPSVVFDQQAWDSAPDIAKILGCTPDFNAWSGRVNPPPECKTEPTLRTASGHLHIGWRPPESPVDAAHLDQARNLVRQLDWYLGGWSLLRDADPTRRKLYGKAGACRYKSYGVEYRVLSNFWVMDTDMHLEVWNRMQSAIHGMLEGGDRFVPALAETFRMNKTLIRSINTSTADPELFRQFQFPLSSLNSSQ